MRFEMKPGKSLAPTGVFPCRIASARTASNVASEVARPRMTSTSFMTGTGLK